MFLFFISLLLCKKISLALQEKKMSEPTKLNLQCIDVLLAQLTKEDLDKFNEKQEKRVLSKIWKLEVYGFCARIFRANDLGEVVRMASKWGYVRDSIVDKHGLVKTDKCSYDENWCDVCNKPISERHHSPDDLTDDNWLKLLYSKLEKDIQNISDELYKND